MQVRNTTSNRTYMYGDFDKDGTANIDDSRPFDRHVSTPVNQEVSLAHEFLEIEKVQQRYEPIVKKMGGKGMQGRIKSLPSIIKKLREKKLKEIYDVGAVTYVVKDRKEAYKVASQLKREYYTPRNLIDDFYKHRRKGNPHRAIHLTSYERTDKKRTTPLEIQIKSMKMMELDNEAHPYYKKHIPYPKSLIRKYRFNFNDCL